MREHSPQTEATEATAALDHRINGRYRLCRRLGSGGMGTVFLVEDTRRDDLPLALKCVRADRVRDNALPGLQREFLALSTLRHPGIAQVYDFGADAETDDFFFTMEFVPGVELLDATKTMPIDEPGGLENFLEIAVQLLRTLAYIHSQGLLHSDIKPQNILIDAASGPTARRSPLATKLVDFGLTAEEKQFTGRKIIGTRSYIAPESVIGSHLDRRADLYSLGAVLYHVVTGSPPFDRSSNLQVLRDHLEKAPAPPSTRNRRVPRALDPIILRLMAKKPADRFENALEVIEAINACFKTDFALESDATRLSYLRSCRPVGRENALFDLYRSFVSRAYLRDEPEEHRPQLSYLSWVTKLDRETFADLTLPRPPRVVVLDGEKGSGKRTVLSHFKRLVQTLGVRFVWVDCDGSPSGESASPDGMEDVLSALESDAWSDEEVSELIMGLRGRRTDPEPLFAALAERLHRLSVARPIVIHFHRIGSARAEVCSFLKALLEVNDQDLIDSGRLLVTVSRLNRLDTADVGPLRALESDRLRDSASVIRLDRLGRDAIERVLEAMFPGSDVPAPFARGVLEKSDGNWAAVIEICEYLVSEELIRRTTTGWTVLGDLDGIDVPIRLRDELRERIQALPRSSFSLGVAFAILGRSANAGLAAQLARINEGEAQRALCELKRDGILERISSADEGDDDLEATFSFVHSSAQQILYDIVTPEKRRQFHDLAGAFCLQYDRGRGRENVKRLAYQFLNARNRENGVRYGMRAARIYTEELKLRKALQTFDEVESLCDDHDLQALDRIQLERARIHFELGEFEQSTRVLAALLNHRGPKLEAREQTRAFLALARANARLGLFVMAEGWLTKAAESQRVETALARGGIGETGEVDFLAVQAEIALLQGRYKECAEACREALSRFDTTTDVAVKCHCRIFLADNAFALDRNDEALSHCREALRLIGTNRQEALIDLACHIEAKMHKYAGRFPEALHFYRLCAVRRRDNDLTDSWVDVLLEMAGIHLFLERPQKALPLLQEAVKACRKTKNTMSTVKAQNLLAETYRLLGQFEDASELVRESEQMEARIRGSQRARWESLLVEGKITLDRGKLGDALDLLEAARQSLPEDTRSKLKAYALLCTLELRAGRFHTALNYCSAGLAGSKTLRNPILSSRFLELRATMFQRLGQFNAAYRVLTVLHDVTREYRLPVRAGRAQLLEGLVAHGEGATDRAFRHFDNAERIFREEESEADLAWLYLERGWIELLCVEYENCFLLIEEAQYLSKKMNLNYVKPRIYNTLAVFEMRSPDGERAKAESWFRHAEKLARENGYVDLLWQILFYFGTFLLENKRTEEGKRLIRRALKGRALVLSTVPAKYREGFLSASPGEKHAEGSSGPAATTEGVPPP